MKRKKEKAKAKITAVKVGNFAPYVNPSVKVIKVTFTPKKK